MPTVLRSGITAILQAIEDRLVARACVPDASLVKWVTAGMTKDEVHLDAEHDILLCPRGFTSPPTQCWVTGAGRYGTKLTRRLDVIPRTRKSLDNLGQAKVWLGGTDGHFTLEEKTLDALLLFAPMDGSSNQLTACPLHPLQSADPEKDRQDNDWGFAALSFEVQYLFAADQTVI